MNVAEEREDGERKTENEMERYRVPEKKDGNTSESCKDVVCTQRVPEKKLVGCA